MAQLQGIFINAQTKQAFEERRLAGDIKLTQIAFIKDTKEIWTQGVFYKVAGLTESEVIELINQHGSGITAEEFKSFLQQMTANDFSSNVQNYFTKANTALQSDDVYNWALSGNTDKIPASKLDDVLKSGYLYNNRFYSTKSGGEYLDEITASGDKFYYDKDTNKLYVYQNNSFTQVSGNTGEQPDLSSYLTSAQIADIYATKQNLTDAVNELLNNPSVELDSIRELAEALSQKSDVSDIVNNYYSKTQVDNKFETIEHAGNTYVTKSEFADYQASITGELDAIKARLTALENMWSNVPEEGSKYFYLGPTAPTSLSDCTVVNDYLAEQTFTNPSQDSKCYVYVLTEANKTVNFYDPADPNDALTKQEDTTTINGYKITYISDGTNPFKIAKGGSVIVKIS